MNKTTSRIVLAFSLMFFVSLNQAQAITWNEVREQFAQTPVPEARDFYNTNWTCTNLPTFTQNQNFELFMFKFVPVLHNAFMIFSNDTTVTEWVPRWFSQYQGMRTAVAFETTNFVETCETSVENCIVTGKGMRNFGYLRLTPEGELLIEWNTTTPIEKLRVTPVARDTDEKLLGTWMYSYCRQQH